MKKNSFVSIKLRRSDWNKVQEALFHSNYCVVKNMNGKSSVTYSKFAKDSAGFKSNKNLSKRLNEKLTKQTKIKK